MKKLISTLIITTVGLISAAVFAGPITHPVTFICPKPTQLGNFGDRVTGMGVEILSPNTITDMFLQSTGPVGNIPSRLDGYYPLRTSYDGPSAAVTCSYRCKNPEFNDINISYRVTNGHGGQIVYSTPGVMKVLFYVGLKK